MERTAMIFGAALLAATTTASGQGDFPFGEIPGVRSQPTVEVNLGPGMVALVTGAAKIPGGDAAAAANALEGVTNVRVYVYENIADDLPAVLKFVQDSSAALERDGWERVVRVNEDGEQVYVYMKPTTDPAAPAGSIAGITLMIMDEGAGDEAVFINIAGTIRPEQFGRIAGAIGANGLLDGVPGVGVPGAAQKGP